MKATVNFKLIARVICVLLLIFFFVPAFTVSCSGQDISVSAKDAMMGMEMDGRELFEGNFAAFLLLLIPFGALVVTFVNTLQEKIVTIVAGACGAADFIGWMVFRSKMMEYEEQGCSVSSGFAFWLTLLLQIALIASAALEYMGKFPQSAEELAPLVDSLKKNLSSAASAASAAVNAAKVEKWTCPNCGQQLDGTDKFCDNCGTKKPDPEPVKSAPAFCNQCGSPLAPGAAFCGSCGNKIK